MALVKRKVTVRFQLGKGSFGEDGSDTIEVSGLRVSASIVAPGGSFMTSANLRIFGLPPSVMNKLTILGKLINNARRNSVTVFAGDDDAGMAVIFGGTITEAWVDTRAAPAVSFVVSATIGFFDALKPIPPTSFKGTVDAALVVASLAQQAGYLLENSGVNVIVADPYLSGTMVTQLQTIARDGNFNAVIDNDASPTKKIAIWPAGAQRGGQDILLSADAGMVGYPDRTEAGIMVQTLFNPSLVFGIGVQVKSSISPVNGRWTVAKVVHELESETPDGKWFSIIECNLASLSTAVIP